MYGRQVMAPTVALSPIELDFCTKITKEMSDLPISAIFLRAVDPVLDMAPDYYDVIKKPIDLGLIAQRLEQGYYTTVEMWKNDMNLVWKNAQTYNPEKSIIWIIAQELYDVFHKKTELIPKTEFSAWLLKMRKIQQKNVLLFQNKPCFEKTKVKIMMRI